VKDAKEGAAAGAHHPDKKALYPESHSTPIDQTPAAMSRLGHVDAMTGTEKYPDTKVDYPVDDPWQPLDPYDCPRRVHTDKDLPFRRGMY
jgi:hypothetical protein